MRKLILKMSMSVDGFVGGEGLMGLLPPDPAGVAWTTETVRNASLHIMGAKTFRDMAAFYPTSTAPFAPPMNEIPKVVFSKAGPAILEAAAQAQVNPSQPLQPGAESWPQAEVAGGDLAEEIAKLKAGEGAPIVAHGGASFARSLVAANLIDEYWLAVHSVALGKGMPLFTELAAPRPLQLIRSIPFPKGTVAQIYRPL